MNKSKAIEIANKWLNQNSSPRTLEPDEVFQVLEALEFKLKRKIKHTTFLYEHSCLTGSSHFQFNILRVSVNHGKNTKSSILIGSVKNILKALRLHPDILNE